MGCMRTLAADLLTDVILRVFRTNGRLLTNGDTLVGPLGLTSARWQVLGAVALAKMPLTAPQIGAAMGITRQGAQKQINLLVEEGLLEPRVNPVHRRSPLYSLTKRGQSLYEQVDLAQARWANRLVEGISAQDLATTKQVLELLLARLDESPTASEESNPREVSDR
jgi:DNA-binding MarR family transcriptional regulator